MAEQFYNDLPKHFKTLSEKAVVVGQDLADRVWDIKAELQRRIENFQKQEEAPKKSMNLIL